LGKNIEEAILKQQQKRKLNLDKFATQHAEVISKIREKNYDKYRKKCELIERDKYDKKERERKLKVKELNDAKKIIKQLEFELGKKNNIITKLNEQIKYKKIQEQHFNAQLANNGKPTSVQVYERTSRLLAFIKYELDLKSIDDVMRLLISYYMKDMLDAPVIDLKNKNMKKESGDKE